MNHNKLMWRVCRLIWKYLKVNASRQPEWGDKLSSLISGQYDTPPDLSVLAQAFREFAEINKAEANLMVEQIPAGLRVIIRDSENRQMFIRGQVEMTPYFEDLLLKLGPVFRRFRTNYCCQVIPMQRPLIAVNTAIGSFPVTGLYRRGRCWLQVECHLSA